MDHLSTEVEQQQPKQRHIEWRRARVLELSSQGRTEREIATILKVGPATVGRDLSYLNKQARENLKSHVQDRLPDQYQKCMNGLNQVLKIGWNIVQSDSSSAANRLQALALVNDSYKYLMDLTTNGVVITDAIKYVQGKMDHLNNQEKKLLQDIKQQKEKEEDESREVGEEETTNGVF
jgi:hypothetical protein